MQKAAQLFVVFLLTAIVGVGVATLMGVRIGRDDERSRSLGAPVFDTGSAAGAATTQQLVTTGQLREVQDGYLKILRDNPADAGAMRGLIAVRRRLAGDDPVALRRQATAYQQMVASGVEPPEHYSRKALELLASASLQAAAAVESEQRNAPQRANPTVGSATSQGAPPPDKAASTPPASRATPTQGVPAQPAPSKTPVPAPRAQQSQVPPEQAGAPPTPPQPTAPAPTTPEPQTPPAPPAGSTTPQQPAAGQPAPAPGSPEGTVAVVPPTTTGPGVAPSEGSLASVDCQKKTFVLHGSNGDEEYLTAPNFTIYIRGISSERLSNFCGLQRHLGRAAIVWSIPDGDRKIVKSISVVLPAQ